MLVNSKAGASLSEKLSNDPDALHFLAASTFSSTTRYTWRELLEIEAENFPGRTALIVTDESKASRNLKAAIRRRYAEIHEATGNDLLVFSPTMPTDLWYRSLTTRFFSAPDRARELLHKELRVVRSGKAEAEATRNLIEVWSELTRDRHDDAYAKLPVVVLLNFRSLLDEQGISEIEARVFPIQEFCKEDRIVNFFSDLAQACKDEPNIDNIRIPMETRLRAYIYRVLDIATDPLIAKLRDFLPIK